ncbi:MAG: substrate-binding domain-containing protein [Firmicutes bacterium]|nr:substrate-binding domain-containing protein [Bacillota bacterium]
MRKTHLDIKTDILEEIRAQRLQPGVRIPSERELSKKYGVSRTVVRKALSELIDEGILISIPGSGTYVMQPAKPNQPHHKTIAFLLCTRGIPDYTVTTNYFYAQVLRGIELQTRRLGYQCLVSTIDELAFDNDHLRSIIRRVDGLILGELRCEKLHNYIRQTNIPAVLISPSLDSPVFDRILIDNFAGSVAATDYLIRRGHRRIAFLGGSTNSWPAKERFEGYKAGLERNGMKLDEELIRITGWDFAKARKATMDLLDNTHFTAIFAASDLLAMAAMQAIKEANRKIPDDISVVGFDDLETSAQHTPQLTSVHVYKEYMGKLAVTLLLSSLEERKDFGTTTIVPTRLIERKSVGEIGVK